MLQFWLKNFYRKAQRSFVEMAKVFSVSNQKGGVGKTTTTGAIAAGLKLKGFKVLCVDLDPQSNLSFSAGAETEDCPTIYDVLKGEAKTSFSIQKTPSFDIIASNILLSGIELEFTQTGREYLLKEALSSIKNKYDYIFIDTPPALSILTVNAFTASGQRIPHTHQMAVWQSFMARLRKKVRL